MDVARKRTSPTVPYVSYGVFSKMVIPPSEEAFFKWNAKNELRTSYRDVPLNHFIVHSKTSWQHARGQLIRDVDRIPIVGVCIRSGKRRLIGKSNCRCLRADSKSSFSGVMTIATLYNNCYTFVLREARLPLDVYNILTNPTIVKMGFGIMGGVDKFFRSSVLTARAQNVLDLGRHVAGEERWQDKDYVLTRGRKNIPCESDEVANERRTQFDPNVRAVYGMEKMLLLATREDLYDLGLDRAAFHRDYFSKDGLAYVPGLERNEGKPEGKYARAPAINSLSQSRLHEPHARERILGA